MGRNQNQVKDAEYFHEEIKTRLNTTVITPSQFSALLRSHLQHTDFTRRRALHLAVESHSGIGKTSIVEQVVNELGGYLLALRAANMDEGQIMGYPAPSPGNAAVIELRMVRQYAEKIDEARRLGKQLVIFFDELNRGKPHIVKAVFNIMDERMFAGQRLPANTAFIIATNPPNGNYNVIDIYGEDAALNARFKIIGLKADLNDFLAYANSEPKFHWLMKEWVKANPNRLYDFENMQSGGNFTCPAVLDSLAHYLTDLEAAGISLSTARLRGDIRHNIIGAAGKAAGDDLLDFVSDGHKHVPPISILEDYPRYRHMIKLPEEGESTEGADFSRTMVLTAKVAEYIGAAKPDFGGGQKAWATNLAAFLNDMGDEVLDGFVTTLNRSLGDSRVDYLRKLAHDMLPYEEFRDASRRMTSVRLSGESAFKS